MTPMEIMSLLAFGVMTFAALAGVFSMSRYRSSGGAYAELRSDMRGLGAQMDRLGENLGEVRQEVHEVRQRLPRRIGGRYDLMHRVGEGSAGVVWRATDWEDGMPVAVKLLRREITEGLPRVRFLREAQVALQLHHPNIVRTYDAGEDASGQLYIVMELLDGRTLREVIEQRSLEGMPDVHFALHIGLAMARALVAAGEHKIVHRDIKPENICMPSSGRVLLADFGLGFVTSSTSEHGRLTDTGVISGTPHYMSPEQCRGEELTQATDVYSLGCVLYELATGGPPFSGRAASAIMLQHSDANRPRPTAGNTQFAGVLGAMMQFEPSRRPTPARLVELFEACLEATDG